MAFKDLTGLDVPDNMPKSLVKKYVLWYEQLASQKDLKEFNSLLKGANKANQTKFVAKVSTKIIREYQDNKYEVSIIDGGFFMMVLNIKVYRRLQERSRVRIGMVTYFLSAERTVYCCPVDKLFFGVND